MSIAAWLQQSVKWMTIPILLYALLVGLLFTAEGIMMKIPGRCAGMAGSSAGWREGFPAAQKIAALAQPIRRVVSDWSGAGEPRARGRGVAVAWRFWNRK